MPASSARQSAFVLISSAIRANFAPGVSLFSLSSMSSSRLSAAFVAFTRALVIFERFCRAQQCPAIPTNVRNAEQFAIRRTEVRHGVLGQNAVPPASQVLEIDPTSDRDELLADDALHYDWFSVFAEHARLSGHQEGTAEKEAPPRSGGERFAEYLCHIEPLSALATALTSESVGGPVRGAPDALTY